MNKPTKKLNSKIFIHAAEYIFKAPTEEFACLAIESRANYTIDSYNLRRYFQQMFEVGHDNNNNTFNYKYCSEWDDRVISNPDWLNKHFPKLKEIRILALCLAKAAYDAGAKF